jgi:CRP/FNR family transcriptional regulator, cyclic AMP receptor protein
MASIATSPELHTQLEDILEYLPIASTTEYPKDGTIFGPENVSKNIYLIVSGKVGISQIAEDGSEVLLEIIRPDELFGESAFLDLRHPSERATALETTRVMSWAISDIEDLVVKRPRLGVALLQMLAQRNIDCHRRIESLSCDTIERRLARSLIRFSERLGDAEEDGSVRLMPFTHEMLSRYVGTSREVITHYMNRFRKRGYLSYSRKSIVLYCDPLKEVLDRTHIPSAARGNTLGTAETDRTPGPSSPHRCDRGTTLEPSS